MSAPSGRPTRSRVSTPNVSTPKDSSRESADKNGTTKSKRGSKEGWQEPPIPQPKPSFADAGMERHGVVANMAPLGTHPSAKALKALMRGDQSDGSARSRRREASVASTPAESLNTQTPEPTQTPEATQTPEQAEAEVVESLELVLPGEPVDAPEEAEGISKPSSRRSASPKTEPGEARPTTPSLQDLPVATTDTRMSLPAQSPTATNGIHAALNLRPVSEPYNHGQSSLSNNSPTPYVVGHSLPPYPATPAQILPRPLPKIGPDGEFEVDLGLTERVLEYACQHALDDGRYPTAYALRTMYDDLKNHNPSVRMMEALYGGFATPPQRQDFLTQIAQRKAGGKKGRTAEYYFNGDGSDLPIPPPRRSSFISPMGSANNNISVYTAVLPTPYQTPYSPLVGSAPASATFASSDPAARPSSLDLRSPSPLSPSPEPGVRDEPPAKKQKMNDFDEPQAELNGDSTNGSFNIPDAVLPATGAYDGSLGSPNQRASRSGSVSSSSSALSSVNEEVLANTSAFNSPVKVKRPESPPLSETPPSFPVQTKIPLAFQGTLYANFFSTPRPFVSPYASVENFKKVAAETLADTPAGIKLTTPPIKAAAKSKGPKMYSFATVPKASAASASASAAPRAPSSDPNNNLPNPDKAQSSSPPPTKSKSKTSMAAAAIESASTTTSRTTPTPTLLGNPPTKSIFNTRTNRLLNKEKAAKAQTPTPPESYDPDDTPNRLKSKARERTNQKPDVFESNERHQVIPHLPEAESDADSTAVNVNNKRTKKTLKLRAPTTRARRNNNDESDENQSSPTVLSFHPDIAPGSVSTSRAGTPNIFSRPTRKGKTGTGLRVKTSPMKKKTGTLAGLPRASGERNSPTGGLNPPGENDDYCSCCGGNGGLVCCDGCDRSFHYQCVDPPMIEGALPDDAWFCNVCQSTRQPPHPDEGLGAFGPLLFNLDRKNPSSFTLPEAVRERFEGVRTGAEGEYEEIAPPKAKGGRPGWEEAPDYFRSKDPKGNLIICFHCHTTASAPDRKIIPCTYCPHFWHLDCVPTPLAKEPGAGRQWRCPLHVDDLLLQLPAQLAPAHRFRKVKGSTAVRPAVSRGIRNNGHIEVDNPPSDDEEMPIFYEQREYDQVYKLPEQGLKLDFISKVRRDGGGDLSRLVSRERSPRVQVHNWSQQGIEEQQAALNLAALANEVPKKAKTNTLINALLNQAPPAVVSMLAQGSAPALSNGSISDNERQSLLAMKALIEKRLGTLTEDSFITKSLLSSPTPSSISDLPNGDDVDMLKK